MKTLSIRKEITVIKQDAGSRPTAFLYGDREKKDFRPQQIGAGYSIVAQSRQAAGAHVFMGAKS